MRIALEIIKCANCKKNLLKQKLTTTRIIINIFSIMRKNHKKSRKIGQCKFLKNFENFFENFWVEFLIADFANCLISSFYLTSEMILGFLEKSYEILWQQKKITKKREKREKALLAHTDCKILESLSLDFF